MYTVLIKLWKRNYHDENYLHKPGEVPSFYQRTLIMLHQVDDSKNGLFLAALRITRESDVLIDESVEKSAPSTMKQSRYAQSLLYKLESRIATASDDQQRSILLEKIEEILAAPVVLHGDIKPPSEVTTKGRPTGTKRSKANGKKRQKKAKNDQGNNGFAQRKR